MHLLDSPAGKQWQRVGVKHHHGINVPLFSLKSENSCGIGEFLDLIPLITWCQENHLDVIQLLPINDIGDSTSPYSLLSAFALNPDFISLWGLPLIGEYGLNDLLLSLQALNGEERIDYAKVRAGKDLFLRTYYGAVGDRIKNSLDYLNFLSKNEEWLFPYALFKSAKIKHHYQSFKEWGTINPDELQDEVEYHIFLQYLCFSQMSRVKKEAENHGIFLKGDIPILITVESADVFFNPELFDLTLHAGAPPDLYAKQGQNWGFPLYNWEKIAEKDYAWWKLRLKVAENFYHLYRLDHVVGFYRIWGIPNGRKATEGFFVPGNRDVWVEQGHKILKMLLDASDMLPIGEDLGTIPPEVRRDLKELGISGTKVMRWERYWDQDKRFIPFDEYSQVSMTTVTTHDMETLKQWWKEKPDEAKEFARFMGFSYEENLMDEQHLEILKASHHTKSLFHINLLQEYLSLVPNMTYESLESERINNPAKVTDKNWTYRFKPYLNEILASEELRKVIQMVRW